MSPPEAAVIGRDLLLRRHRLFTGEFSLAAFLASNGEAGNDSFMDFTDCMAILPEERYSRIVGNPDELIDDEVSVSFGEFYFVSRVTKVFDRALVDDEVSGFLHYLVLGDGADLSKAYSWDASEVADRLPRLHAKFGYLLAAQKPRATRAAPHGNRVTLDDMIP